jgi:hypothetical protein
MPHAASLTRETSTKDQQLRGSTHYFLNKPDFGRVLVSYDRIAGKVAATDRACFEETLSDCPSTLTPL